MQTGSDLPPPDPVAQAHSDRVLEHVRVRIRERDGFLSFADYMELVLYAPGLGYYSAGAAKFGAAGDFVTAPGLGSVFARCLARLAGDTLAQLDRGVILEVGGGSGTLAADLLRALRHRPPDRYLLLEVSGELRERQRQTLAARVPEFLDRVEWLDRWPAAPLNGVFIANEVLDALPVDRFRAGPDGTLQLGVTARGGRLAWDARPAPPALAAAVNRLEERLGAQFPAGFQGEIAPGQSPWLQSFVRSLGRGLALCIDYGGSRREVYHPDRRDGTLACHYRHRRHADPFLHPGLQDITAWVDFSAAADAAVAGGADLVTYATQAHVLLAAGVLDPPGGDRELTEAARLAEAQEIQRLILPGGMGEHFKVLALGRDFAPARALAVRDLRDRLEAAG